MKFRFRVVFMVVIAALCAAPQIGAVHAQEVTSCKTGFRLLKSEMVVNGPVCVPEHPQRIAAVDTFTLETLIALGVKPVSGPFLEPFNREHPQLKAQTEGIIETGWPVSLETLVASKPDLILSIDPWINKAFDGVAQIAPTVSIKYRSDDDWKNIARTVGEAINQSDALEAAITAYEARLAIFREEITKKPVGEVSIAFVYPDGMQAFLTTEFSSQIVKEAGLHFPKVQEDQIATGWDGAFSKERLDLLETSDHIFVLTSSFTAEDVTTNQKLLDTLQADPLWQFLPATKAGHIHLVKRDWLGSSVIAANAVLDDLFVGIIGQQPADVSPDPYLTPATEATPEATP